MTLKQSRFQRVLIIVLVLLFVASISAFLYTNWAADPGQMKWWNTVLSGAILAIPLSLVYGSIYILAIGWREHSTLQQIEPRLARIIHWAPRVAAGLIIFFISLFSLDVFESGAAPLEMLGGFLIHNIPSIAMLVLLIIAWHRPAVGFAVFLVAAILFSFFFVRDVESLPNLLLFVLPMLLISGLFYADWQWLKA